ncbi:hypothetical protein M422DRAFT_273019 [Sphaerobolus stellatus SS14]|uniref:Uncharacterized protein n=1 Tax=Sphaerobolus stellatus (strain SS14) TaxID=990650 RepID=A0A0C9UKL8_SPHS4|nr:hypothetical protein M422DRAFT_273019 [Sphaerobolus stellatus SS14]
MSTLTSACLIVLDDTSDTIKYNSNDWFFTTPSQEMIVNSVNADLPDHIPSPVYNNSLHGTQRNSSFSLTFNGSYIDIYGSLKVSNTTLGELGIQWKCLIDGAEFDRSGTQSNGSDTQSNQADLIGKAAINDQLLCTTTSLLLLPGTYELEVQVTILQESSMFWLDYLRYLPNPGNSLENSVILVPINDSDIKLVGGSQIGQEFPISVDSEESKLALPIITLSTGDSLSFNFTGTGVSLYGVLELPLNAATFNPEQNQAMYAIDEDSPVIFEPDISEFSSVLQFDFGVIFDFVYFSMSDMPQSLHRLNITSHTSLETIIGIQYLIIPNGSSHNTQPGPSAPALPSQSIEIS